MPDLAARRCLDWGGRVVGREVMLGLETADVAGEPDDDRRTDRPDLNS